MEDNEMTEDEGRKALEAAKEAVERAQFLDMLPASVAEAAIKAYLAALPGWRLVPLEQQYRSEPLPDPPGLGDSE